MLCSENRLKVGLLASALTLVALSTLVVVLASQNRNLKSELAEVRQRDRLNLPYPDLMVPTFATRAVRAGSAGGVERADTVVIGENEEDGVQILFVLRSTCPHCLRTLPYWNDIVKRIRDQRLSQVEVFGLSKEPEADIHRFVQEHDLAFPVVRFPNEKLADMYGVIGTPITLVLNGQGKIAYARLGALSTDVAADSVMEAVRRTLEEQRLVASRPDHRHPRP